MKTQLINLLKQLPEPIADMAITNLNIRDFPHDTVDYKHITDVALALRVSFKWGETPQGFDFWCDIHKKVEKK